MMLVDSSKTTALIKPVETKPFLEVFADKTGGNPKVQTSEYLESGKFPIVDQGQKAVAGYSNDESLLAANHGPVIIFGDHTRILKYVEGPFILGADGTKVLVPRISADVRFLFHYLRFVDIPSAGYSRHFKFLKEIQVPLPPLPEQRQIAAILDKADHLRTQRREALAHLDGLTQSIFSSMFHSPGQRRTSLGELLNFVTSGGRGWAKYYSESGSRFIRSLDVQRNVVNEDTAIFVDAPDNAEARRTKVRTNDVLLTITGSLIGRAAPVLSSSAGAFISQHVAILRPVTEEILPVYLSYFLNQENGGQRIIKNMQYGQTKPGLNFEQIRKFELPLPPLELQQTFARRVAGVERLKEKHRTQLAELDVLFASLQHRAFRGEL
ncbi:type I restriction enzyme S subunit [Arthrobacter sp. UYCu511]|uniref:restriction endonuclease subunit S n=1 Tax=Arthrobacter sp. UYCu511 TaxID=3156337 RepID=UPI0033932C10